MYFCTIEYATEDEVRRAWDHLWRKLQVTGEVSVKPAPDGRWYLEVASEKDLTPQTLEKLGGVRL